MLPLGATQLLRLATVETGAVTAGLVTTLLSVADIHPVDTCLERGNISAGAQVIKYQLSGSAEISAAIDAENEAGLSCKGDYSVRCITVGPQRSQQMPVLRWQDW